MNVLFKLIPTGCKYKCLLYYSKAFHLSSFEPLRGELTFHCPDAHSSAFGLTFKARRQIS